MAKWLLGMVVLLASTGCGTGYYVVAKDDTPEVVWYDANRRAQIVIPVFSQAEEQGKRKVVGYKVVCEPPPDSVMETTLSAALSGKYNTADMSSIEISGSLDLKRTALLLASRTERVELLRDALFSLNLSTVNLQASPSEYHESYRVVIQSVLQSTLSDSVADAAQASTRAQELAAAADSEIATLESKSTKTPSDLARLDSLKKQRDSSLKLAGDFQRTQAKLSEALTTLAGEGAEKPKPAADETVQSLLKGAKLEIDPKPRLWAFGDNEGDKTISSIESAKTALVDGVISKELKKNVGLFWNAGYHGAESTVATDQSAFSADGITCKIYIAIPATLKGDKGKDKRLSVVLCLDENQRAFNADAVTLSFAHGNQPTWTDDPVAEGWSGICNDLPDDARPDHKTWEVALPNDVPKSATHYVVTLVMKAATIKARQVQTSGLAISEIYVK